MEKGIMKTHSNGLPLSTPVTAILRRDVGSIQYVLSEGPSGFIITGMDRATSQLVSVKPCTGMDDGIAQFRNQIQEGI